MATPSQVKAGLDDISQRIRLARQQLTAAKGRVTQTKNDLNGLPNSFSDVITTIDGFTPTGAFETLAKDERDKLATEFQALAAAAAAAETALSSITEF